jgi:hypothetical protein
MRDYKQEQSALGISRLIAFAGNHLARGLRLADLTAQLVNHHQVIPSSLFVASLLGAVTAFD